MSGDTELAVITVTKNAANVISGLARSLEVQTDKDFVWVLQDAKSSDGTIETARRSFSGAIATQSIDDFSIYDGLNRAIKRANARYYLVVGADDILRPDAVEQFRRWSTKGGVDIVSARVQTAKGVVGTQRGLGWLRGMVGEVSSHSVGLLIKSSLHSKYGYYSSRFPIVADQLFVKSALRGGASLQRAEFLAGSYSPGGFSGSDELQFICEFFVMQMRTERCRILQSALFLARLARYLFRSGLVGRQ